MKKWRWLDKKDYVHEMTPIARFLYYLGVIKQKRYTNRKGKPEQIYSGGFYSSLFGFRWWHPFAIIISLTAFVATFLCLCVGCLAQAFKIGVYDFHKSEISVSKPLKRRGFQNDVCNETNNRKEK